MNLSTKTYEADGKLNKSGQPVTIYYRPGTSDEEVIPEVIDRHSYTRRSQKFDVMPGESWLDLGANIGTFSVYARMRGAKEVCCYEPDPECFEILKKNCPNSKTSFFLKNVAVTNRHEKELTFHKSSNPTNHWRATIVDVHGYVDHPSGKLLNMYGDFLKHLTFDGVKMDIEGSEFGLIDDGLLPRCEKLVLEYHINRDERNMRRFAKRMALLRKRFHHVAYAPGLDRMGPEYTGRFDFTVWAFGAR